MSSPLCLAVTTLRGESLSVSFRWIEGRFRHSIILSDAEGTTLDQWEDEVSGDCDDWPASPPIQQLSLETIHDQPTLLGVGQAGKSHWSISVEPIAATERRGLRFDLACRTSVPPGWLGSTYRPASATAASLQKIALLAEHGAVDPQQPNVIASKLVGVAKAKYPCTFRWSYTVTG